MRRQCKGNAKKIPRNAMLMSKYISQAMLRQSKDNANAMLGQYQEGNAIKMVFKAI